MTDRSYQGSKDTPSFYTGADFERGQEAAIEQALQSLPTARARFRAGLPPGYSCFVTIELSDGLGAHENAFVSVQRWDDIEVAGLLATELRTIQAHKYGERLKFPANRIIDWTITDPKGVEEGNFIGKHMDSLSYALSCKKPGCGVRISSMSASIARAHLAEKLRTDATAAMRLACPQCSQTSSYTMEEILERIPVGRRPRPCPSGEFWGIVLAEIPTADSMSDRFFLGELVYCYLVGEAKAEWQAKILSASRFLKPLGANDLLIGTKNGKFDVVTGVVHEGTREDVPLVSEISKGSDLAAFFVTKLDSNGPLRTATLFCANPICSYPFALTHAEWLKRCRDIQQAVSKIEGSEGVLSVTCPKCGTCRVVNEDSFHGMVLL